MESPSVPVGIELLQDRREEIRRIAARHDAYNVRVLGSFARGDAGPQSNLDLLISVGPNTMPWFPGGLVSDLEQLLDRRADVLTENGLSPLIRDRVLNEAVPL